MCKTQNEALNDREQKTEEKERYYFSKISLYQITYTES